MPGNRAAPWRARVPAGWRLFVLLLVWAVMLRARDFGNPIIHVDEQYYLLVGDRMRHGAWPYLDLWDRKPVGLFLIFAAIRLLPGDAIWGYQLAATLFAAVTAWLIAHGSRRLGAGPASAAVAGLAYILWLSLLSGRGGQSPVFYNLFMGGAGVLTLRLPDLAARRAGGAIATNGIAACLLAGLAVQTKYTPAVEGAFFGLAHMWYAHRAGMRPVTLAAAALLWASLGLFPTALAALAYTLHGPAAFDAFWFANFTSVSMRRGYPAMKIAARLAGTGAQLLPFVVAAVAMWRRTPRPPAVNIAFGWLLAAGIAFAMIGAFFDHYAIPLMVPLAMIAGAALRGEIRWAAALLGYGLILFVARVLLVPTEASSARSVAQVMKAYDGSECPYVFAGDAVLYLLADACVPTAYAFPSTLAYDPERGATGVDEAAEVRRILARGPPVIVTMDEPMAPWNPQTQPLVAAVLAAKYQRVLTAPREDAHLLVYVRRDRLHQR
ncbi:ArnT family glycosyltransferase [Sphingomonas sp.]|uniref:ArnT family glycosyltransferase n=1 Tax=Sphingomonas sp. TaxID=28214 RepID=UPI003CC57421